MMCNITKKINLEYYYSNIFVRKSNCKLCNISCKKNKMQEKMQICADS